MRLFPAAWSALSAVGLLAAGCAPLSPEQLAERRAGFAANQQCERIATQRSGVLPGNVGEGDTPSGMAADWMWEGVYDDCMRQRGFDPYQFYH